MRVTNIQIQALLYMILLDQGRLAAVDRRLAAVDRRLPTVTTIDRFYCTRYYWTRGETGCYGRMYRQVAESDHQVNIICI